MLMRRLGLSGHAVAHLRNSQSETMTSYQAQSGQLYSCNSDCAFQSTSVLVVYQLIHGAFREQEPRLGFAPGCQS